MAAKFFGQFLLEKGVIDAAQLLRALEIQRVSNPALGEIACAASICEIGDVRLAPGVNRVTASARFAGRVVSDVVEWTLTPR